MLHNNNSTHTSPDQYLRYMHTSLAQSTDPTLALPRKTTPHHSLLPHISHIHYPHICTKTVTHCKCPTITISINLPLHSLLHMYAPQHSLIPHSPTCTPHSPNLPTSAPFQTTSYNSLAFPVKKYHLRKKYNRRCIFPDIQTIWRFLTFRYCNKKKCSD
jgi:hypothetical protein